MCVVRYELIQSPSSIILFALEDHESPLLWHAGTDYTRIKNIGENVNSCELLSRGFIGCITLTHAEVYGKITVHRLLDDFLNLRCFRKSASIPGKINERRS